MAVLETPMFTTHAPAGVAAAQWFAVRTRSRFEKIVRSELEASGIESYLATFQTERQWKDRKKMVEMPLFSGYIFARFRKDADETRIRVLRTVGVAGILGTRGILEPVADHEIDSLRRLLQSGSKCYPHPFLREGSWVRVRRGALSGVEGRLLRVKNQTRLILSVNLLSQSVATEVDSRDVEPVPERRPGE